MPLQEVCVECNVRLCWKNKEGLCQSEKLGGTLDPNVPTCCDFSLKMSDFSCFSQEQVESVLDLLRAYNIPFVELDSKSNQFTVTKCQSEDVVIRG